MFGCNYSREDGQGLGPVLHPLPTWEKGAVNWSGIQGASLPESAAAQLKIPPNTPYRATGVSLIMHPSNPHVPTVHMNVRFFCCGDRWWFGGGIDATPYYPNVQQVVEFHTVLRDCCQRHSRDYDALKARCDQYFVLPHRNETRGVGGLFYDSIHDDYEKCKAFTFDLGRTFVKSYAVFFSNMHLPFTRLQREFCLYRRGRYVEFNLLFDRGTKFGISSGGRSESILVSLPAEVHWVYNYKPPVGSDEAHLYNYFLQPQDWLHLGREDIRKMASPWAARRPIASATRGKQTEPLDAQAAAAVAADAHARTPRRSGAAKEDTTLTAAFVVGAALGAGLASLAAWMRSGRKR